MGIDPGRVRPAPTSKLGAPSGSSRCAAVPWPRRGSSGSAAALQIAGRVVPTGLGAWSSSCVGARAAARRARRRRAAAGRRRRRACGSGSADLDRPALGGHRPRRGAVARGRGCATAGSSCTRARRRAARGAGRRRGRRPVLTTDVHRAAGRRTTRLEYDGLTGDLVADLDGWRAAARRCSVLDPDRAGPRSVRHCRPRSPTRPTPRADAGRSCRAGPGVARGRRRSAAACWPRQATAAEPAGDRRGRAEDASRARSRCPASRPPTRRDRRAFRARSTRRRETPAGAPAPSWSSDSRAESLPDAAGRSRPSATQRRARSSSPASTTSTPRVRARRRRRDRAARSPPPATGRG